MGGLLGISLLIAGIFVLRHRRKKAASSSPSEKRDSTQSFGHIISAPMPHADYYNQRLDFLAKAQSQSAASTPHSHSHAQGGFPPNSPYSPFAASSRHGSVMTDMPRSHHASAEVGGLRNLTDRYSGGSSSAASVLNHYHNFNNNTQPPQVPLSVLQTLPENTAAAQQQQQGERMHSINVFADPLTVGSPSIYNRRDTTWTELQHHADHDSGADSPVPKRR